MATLQKAYREEMNKQVEELHNAIVDLIVNMKADRKVVLEVLLLLTYENLEEKLKQVRAKSSTPKPIQ